MRRQLAARFIQSLVVVFVVTTISFFVIRSAPGDPFSFEASTITPALRQRLRDESGYNKPLHVQFIDYTAKLAHGNLGYSQSRHQDVADVLRATIPRTLLLTGLSLALSLALGVIVGVLQATRRDGWFDRLTSTTLIFLYSLPDFWAALMIVLLFAYWMPSIPTHGIVDPTMHDYLRPWAAFVDRLSHLVLPVGTFTLLTMAGVSRYQRAAMLETLPADFIRTARAKGLSERQIVWRHALRNSLTPLVTLLGLMLPALLGGAVFIEKVFGWPGMGSLAAEAVAARDYDLVTATVIAGSVMVVIGNLLADLLHMALDPRVRE